MTINTTTQRLPSAGRARLPILIAALLLLAFIGSGMVGSAQAQAGNDSIPSITLDSHQPGQLTITWEAPEQAPTDYRIRWANTDLDWLSWTGDNEAERANEYPLVGVNTLTLQGLTPGDTYKVQIRSRYYNADRTVHESSGPWTDVITQRVKDHPPAAPTGLTASQVAHDSLILSWDDPNDSNITGYQIQRGTDANSLLTIQADTGSSSTTYTDATVEPETTYHYAVQALSQDGDGTRSTTSVTTPAEPQSDPPAAPTGLTAARVGHSVVTLSWNNSQDESITGYRILRGASANSLATLENDTESVSTEYEDATVAPETTYHYAVAALSPNGAGVQSTTISATTPAAPKSKDPPPQDAGARQAPPVTILVSNLTDGTDSDNNFGSADHAQAFTTGATSSTVASVTIISLDAEADDISLKVCGVDTNTHPTSTCTALTSPLSFTAGEMTFTVPTGTPLTLDANTTYSVVFNSPGDDTVRVEATWGDGEDSESLAGWSIRNRSQVQNTDNSWRDRGEDKAIRMAVSGTADATTTNPPTVENEIPDRSATVGTAFSHTFATDTFADADGDTLTYTATKADDTTLPTWLTFTANTRTFSGTPTAAETVSVKVTASDGNGGSVSDTFDIAVSTAPTDMVAPTILVSNMGQGADSNNDFTVLDGLLRD